MQYPVQIPCLVGNLQVDKRATVNAEKIILYLNLKRTSQRVRRAKDLSCTMFLVNFQMRDDIRTGIGWVMEVQSTRRRITLVLAQKKITDQNHSKNKKMKCTVRVEGTECILTNNQSQGETTTWIPDEITASGTLSTLLQPLKRTK